MAHFIGYLQGNRGQASRLGSKKSGISAQAQGWNIGAKIELKYNPEKDRDEVFIYQTGGSNSGISTKLLKTLEAKL